MVKGSQSEKIKAVMNHQYATMISEQTSNAMSGIVIGGVIGLATGTLMNRNKVLFALIGAAAGFLLIRTK